MKEAGLELIDAAELKKLARAHLRDAEILLAAGRPDGAAYLSGYVVELALKARICRTLKWSGYPESRNDFSGVQAFKTHDLDQLLRLTGREAFVKTTLLWEWNVVSPWTPEWRYQSVGTTMTQMARAMIDAARRLLERL